MPKFFFTTDDGQPDEQEAGLEFRDEKAAAAGAQEALADIAHEKLPNGPHADFRIKVEDEGGDEIYRTSLIFSGQSRDDARRQAEAEEAAAEAASERIAALLRSKAPR